MALLIDSSVLITLERRGQETAMAALRDLDEPGALASITVSELLTGAFRADTPVRRRTREEFVDAILEILPTLPFDIADARVHAEIWAELAATGRMIGPYDLIIAATALSRGYTVLTENLREFERVPGLKVLRPTW